MEQETNKPELQKQITDRQGVMMTAALMIITAVKGTDEEVQRAMRLTHEDKILLAMKYFEEGRTLISEMKKKIFTAEKPNEKSKTKPN